MSKGLAYWDDAAAAERISAEALAAMRAQPHFADAMRHAVTQSLRLFEQDAVMTRALRDVGRVVSGMIALYLDADGGLTLSRIQRFLSDMGMTSPGRAAAILIQLRLLGYVALAAEQPNRRVRRYKPTPRMQNAFRAHFRKDFEALSRIEPDAAPLLARFDEPQVFVPVIVRFGQGLVDAARVHERDTPGLDLFSQRNAGLMILSDLLLAAEAPDEFPPKGTIRFSVSGLARRFGVSRPHVLKLLRDAERAGFLKRDAEEGRGALLEPLRELVANYYATVFIGMAACAHAALRAGAPSQRPSFAAETGLSRPLD